MTIFPRPTERPWGGETHLKASVYVYPFVDRQLVRSDRVKGFRY